jgi:hypothetical protein
VEATTAAHRWREAPRLHHNNNLTNKQRSDHVQTWRSNNDSQDLNDSTVTNNNNNNNSSNLTNKQPSSDHA